LSSIDDDDEEEEEDEDDIAENYRQALYQAFTSDYQSSSFAVGGEIPSNIGTPVVHVNNDRIAYPLCKPQAKVLIVVG
jgi:hypothetical protein